MLLDRDCPQVKLIDFGLSRKMLPGVETRDMIGTPEFVGECFQNKLNYNRRPQIANL